MPKSKLVETLKTTIGYGGVAYDRGFRDAWPNDNPIPTTSTSTATPLATVATETATQSPTAMLEVFQWAYTTTIKPIFSTVSTWAPSSWTNPSTAGYNKNDWGNSVETYHGDKPPHLAGLSPAVPVLLVEKFSSFSFRRKV